MFALNDLIHEIKEDSVKHDLSPEYAQQVWRMGLEHYLELKEQMQRVEQATNLWVPNDI